MQVGFLFSGSPSGVVRPGGASGSAQEGSSVSVQEGPPLALGSVVAGGSSVAMSLPAAEGAGGPGAFGDILERLLGPADADGTELSDDGSVASAQDLQARFVGSLRSVPGARHPPQRGIESELGLSYRRRNSSCWRCASATCSRILSTSLALFRYFSGICAICTSSAVRAR